MPLQISRRAFVASLAASVVVPKGCGPVTAAEADLETAPLAKPLAVKYGFTFDQYLYETGFPTRMHPVLVRASRILST